MYLLYDDFLGGLHVAMPRRAAGRTRRGYCVGLGLELTAHFVFQFNSLQFVCLLGF